MKQSILEEKATMSKERKKALIDVMKKQITEQEATPAKIRKVIHWITIFRIAALFLLPLITGITVYQLTTNTAQNQEMVVKVDKGQKAILTLPDGSEVSMNPSSRLSYDAEFNKKERSLQLTGEAFFKVAKDPKRSFIIHAGAISIKALGTSFYVKAYEEDNNVTVALEEGKVAVTTDTQQYVLLPNECVIYNKKTQMFTKSVITEGVNYSAWKENTLQFNNERLGDIALTLERIYNTQIIFESESLKEQRITGTLKNNNLKSIFNTFMLSCPILYEIEDSVITLSENKALSPYFQSKQK